MLKNMAAESSLTLGIQSTSSPLHVLDCYKLLEVPG